jgi:hypothetical protein
MQQRVGLAQALINNPDLLILDEPTSGLDPLGRMKVREIIQRLKNEGKTVFFSSHELGEVETVCDRVAIITKGELKAVGRVATSWASAEPRKGLSGHHRLSTAIRAMNNIWAVAGVVIKELYRRKDFYVLFILTIVICVVMASVNIFNDNQIVRYLKELCLLLIWISSLVIAITTTARQIPGGARTTHPASAAGQAVEPDAVDFRKIPRLLAGLRPGAGGAFMPFFGALAASREHDGAWPLLNYFQAAFYFCTGSCSAIWSSRSRCSARSLDFAAPSSGTRIQPVMIFWGRPRIGLRPCTATLSPTRIPTWMTAGRRVTCGRRRCRKFCPG